MQPWREETPLERPNLEIWGDAGKSAFSTTLAPSPSYSYNSNVMDGHSHTHRLEHLASVKYLNLQ